jgi:hypothetical protein
MDDFPKLMKSASNKIAKSSQSTPGVEPLSAREDRARPLAGP